jgi:hypothetical protein
MITYSHHNIFATKESTAWRIFDGLYYTAKQLDPLIEPAVSEEKF